MDKKERKEFVKEQRKKFVENPSNFISEEVIKPTLEYWKNDPLHAFFTFSIWVIIMYVAFGGIQGLNNDMIYCDSTINNYDGKLMYTFNDFVKYYNEKALDMQYSNFNFNVEEQEIMVDSFNNEYNMMCTYDLKRWWKEPIYSKNYTNVYCDDIYGCTSGKLETFWHGYVKILMKRS